MLTRKARLLLGLTAATPLLFAACHDNGIFNPLADAAGTYTLTVYAGRGIPTSYPIQPGDPNYPQYPNGATLVVNSGTMVLNSNGTFIETNNYVITPNGGGSPSNTAFVSSGTWTLSGSDLSLFAPVQNNNAARNLSGTWTVDTVNGFEAINYLETDGAGGFDPYEYRR